MIYVGKCGFDQSRVTGSSLLFLLVAVECVANVFFGDLINKLNGEEMYSDHLIIYYTNVQVVTCRHLPCKMSTTITAR